MRTDIFARLDREPEPPKIEIPRMSRTRLTLFGGTSAFYLAIVVAVLVSSWLVTLDWKVMLFRPYQQWPELHAFLDYFVVLGQRGPTAVMVAAWLGWRSWRQHTLRPLLALGAALLLLNVTVGAVKIGLGRLGPHYATQIGSAELFAGGDIFPSGHTANAVVTWGILAYLATTPRARRYLSALSAVVALGVGLTTVYLGTHWLSDVLLGWAAGLLILLGLPWCEPAIARAEAMVFAVRERLREQLRARRRQVPSLPVAAGGPRPAIYPQRPAVVGEEPVRAGAGDEPVRESVGAGSGGRTAAVRTTLTQPRPHAVVRSERTPVTPAGSRRPPHSRPVTGG
ncbi:phosphatase PAP2 family protein [Streptomyces sp. SP18CS02]|uniref:phosphatase PAP2 family protein n=1 Tax=Streptomyces sp. SP18CS02 TaxID=3002531 RepID=UPI002E77C803|nr:phosphatase PAP2 family protein [Streptomyces sp. SP18CS02]MEE1752428.1 phosphatase PAP2 family protein [Streptomyces sp. SP18CS02]